MVDGAFGEFIGFIEFIGLIEFVGFVEFIEFVEFGAMGSGSPRADFVWPRDDRGGASEE